MININSLYDKEESYIKRQMVFLSSFGYFWLILLGLFAVPLLGTYVVIFIKGAMDYKNIIITVGWLVSIAIILIFVMYLRNVFKKMKSDAIIAGQELQQNMKKQIPVQLSVFNGLLTFTYGKPLIGLESDKETKLLPLDDNTNAQTHSLAPTIDHLKELFRLKQDGVITPEEFDNLKTKLLHQ